MSKHNIRAITEQDVPFLWDMLYESIFIPKGNQPPNRDILSNPSISKYVEGWGRDGDVGYIAENDIGDSVGSITVRCFDKENRGYGYVNDETPELGMAIMSEYRGKGIGTELMRILIVQLKIKGVKAISLSVASDNPAINLYERFEFVKVGIAGDSIVMLLNL